MDFQANEVLAGFTAIFVICACGLIGGWNNQAFGIEWLTVSVIAAYVYVNGIVKAKRSGISALGIGIYRIVSGIALYVIEILGVLLFTLGNIMGLYVAALAMVVLLAYTITGAWLLVVGVHGERIERQSKKLSSNS